MDESFQAILDGLPPKPGRSKLEPYLEFIRELRRRGRSYQEIAQILRDRCGVTTAVHTVYNFVRVREKPAKRVRARRHATERSVPIATSPEPAEAAHLEPRTAVVNDAWKNIEKLKRRQRDLPAEGKAFEFDENEPLRLVRRAGLASDGNGNNRT